MADPLFVKCRPQDCDIESLCLKHRHVFIGYPPWKKHGGAWDKSCVSQSCFNLLGDWKKIDLQREGSYRRAVMVHRRFAREATPGTLVLLPRPGKGICYVGKITSSFQLIENPPWADEYLELRREQGLPCDPEQSHIGDVIQGWRVDDLVPIPFPTIPRWITYRLLSRNQIGWIRDRPDRKRSAVDAVRGLLSGGELHLSPTRDREEIAGRLLDWLSPTAFEHLVCDVLQCEHPQLRWWHIGGSGDGGVDVIGTDSRGTVHAAVQCKWMLPKSPWTIGEQAARQLCSSWNCRAQVYVAALYQSKKWTAGTQDGVAFLDAYTIADLLIRHSDQIALAVTLGVSSK